jgi:hypothetical protein
MRDLAARLRQPNLSTLRVWNGNEGPTLEQLIDAVPPVGGMRRYLEDMENRKTADDYAGPWPGILQGVAGFVTATHERCGWPFPLIISLLDANGFELGMNATGLDAGGGLHMECTLAKGDRSVPLAFPIDVRVVSLPNMCGVAVVMHADGSMTDASSDGARLQ